MRADPAANQADLLEAIFRASLFEPDWYAAVHPDVARSGLGHAYRPGLTELLDSLRGR